ncbi:hypothetical protein KUCAC02_029923, partial [Chaenocephalus aceratus]
PIQATSTPPPSTSSLWTCPVIAAGVTIARKSSVVQLGAVQGPSGHLVLVYWETIVTTESESPPGNDMVVSHTPQTCHQYALMADQLGE